jgi:TolB-like protein
VPVLATLFGCAGAGASASGAEEAGARPEVEVAVLPMTWATEAPAVVVGMTGLIRELDRAPGVRVVASTRVEAVLAAETEECASDVACIRRVGERARAPHVVVVELAELGGTVLVRASVVDVAAGTRESTRQEVVQRADAARVAAALRRVGRAIAAAWAPPASPADETAWYESAAFWATAAGAVVIAGAVTAIVLVAGDGGPEPDGTIVPP